MRAACNYGYDVRFMVITCNYKISLNPLQSLHTKLNGSRY